MAVEAIAGKKTIFDPRAIPAVVFTDPEVAWCGLTEAEAAEQGIPVKVGRFPWAASGRATTLGRADGVTKIIADPETERILGVGMSGSGAGERTRHRPGRPELPAQALLGRGTFGEDSPDPRRRSPGDRPRQLGPPPMGRLSR